MNITEEDEMGNHAPSAHVREDCFVKENGKKQLRGKGMKRLKVDWAVVLFVAVIFGSVAVCDSPALAQRKSGSNTTRSLHGHVFSPDNKPVGKAIVYLKNTKTHATETYISDPDGSYRFPWLSPRVDYEVHAEFQGARTDTKFISSFDSRKEFDVVLRFQ
jgi:hypothetical protein